MEKIKKVYLFIKLYINELFLRRFFLYFIKD